MEAIAPEWIKIFGPLDISAMIAIGVLAFLLQRSAKTTELVALFFPFVAGALFGAYQAAIESNFVYLPKGALLNGAGATVIARGASLIFTKYWQGTEYATALVAAKLAAVTEAAAKAEPTEANQIASRQAAALADKLDPTTPGGLGPPKA